MAPAAGASMLEDLADRALRSEFEPVICLEAPEAVEFRAACCAPTAQHLPAAQRRAVRHPRAAGHGGTPRRASRCRCRAAPDARRRRTSTRRRPGAARGHAGRTHARNSRSSSRTYAADCRAGRGCAVGADRWEARLRDQRTGRVGEDTGDDRSRTGLGRATLDSCRPSRTAAPCPCSSARWDTCGSPIRSKTGRVSPGTVSYGPRGMTDAQPHRPVHRVAVKVIARHPSHLAALITPDAMTPIEAQG